MDAEGFAEFEQRFSRRLAGLRAERGWALDDLAARSGVSRATLSRLENGEVSPTTHVLGKLCAAYGLTLSRLMFLAEDNAPALVPSAAQHVWRDPANGFERRIVSPPGAPYAGEVIHCSLAAGTHIEYERPPRAGLEHHLVLVEGELLLTVDDARHELSAGDCLRYRLFGASRFVTRPRSPARYYLFIL